MRVEPTTAVFTVSMFAEKSMEIDFASNQTPYCYLPIKAGTISDVLIKTPAPLIISN
jgi:hypothetical protein